MFVAIFGLGHLAFAGVCLVLACPHSLECFPLARIISLQDIMLYERNLQDIMLYKRKRSLYETL